MTFIKNPPSDEILEAYKKWWFERMNNPKYRNDNTKIPLLPDFFETFTAGWEAKTNK